MAQLAIPTIHLNGTSRDALTGALETARHALREAIDALLETHPNGRDYYTQEGGAYQKAESQYLARMTALKSVYSELGEVWAGINDACDKAVR